MDVDSNGTRELKNLAARQEQQRLQSEFVDYVIEESSVEISVEAFDTDAVVDALQELSNAGFTVDELDEDFSPPQCFAHPALFTDLHEDFESDVRVEQDSLFDQNRLGVNGVECYPDPAVPEGAAVCIHPEAIVPGVPSDVRRPYLVRSSSGVVVLSRDES